MNEDQQISLLLNICKIIVATKRIVKRNERKNCRRAWSRDWLLRRNSGRDHTNLVMDELRLEDVNSFQNFTRMKKNTFEKLLNKVAPVISKQNTHLREAIAAQTRLLLTLRFLATGQNFRALSYDFRVSVPAISIIIPEVLNAICTVLKDEYLKTPRNKIEWKTVGEEFERQWYFPNCLGALDGKHIAFRAKKSDGSFYYNYKGFHSIILLALVDANYKFLYVDVGCNGRSNDAGVYSNSTLSTAINKNLLDFPEDVLLDGTTEVVPYVILSDEAFRLTHRILKPYGQRKTREEKVFNYRLSRARRVVENAFGILANKFQVLQKDINLDVKKVELVAFTACVLHNFIRTEDGMCYIEARDRENVTEVSLTNGLWRQEVCWTPLTTHIANRSADSGIEIRNRYSRYFNTTGFVPWQWEAIKKFNF